MTLQTAPLLPNGSTWTVEGEPGPGANVCHCFSLELADACIGMQHSFPAPVVWLTSFWVLTTSKPFMCAGMYLASGEQLPGAGLALRAAEFLSA